VLFNSDVGGVVETLTPMLEVLLRSHLLGPYSLLLLLLCLLVRSLKQRRKPVVLLISSMELLLLAWNNRSLLLDRNHTVPHYANMAIFIHHVRLALESFLKSSG
jgi:NADH:ubiquinone oxidoreductase subunit K